MEKYMELTNKLNNNTITEVEKHELLIMAFGGSYLASSKKGSLIEY